MDYSLTFARHFARLVWLLMHETANIDEQKGALRAIVAVAKEGEVRLEARGWELFANDAEIPGALSGVRDLAGQMLGHGIREVTIAQNPSPADVLGSARILAGAVIEGDGGAGALQKLAALDARTVAFVAANRDTADTDTTNSDTAHGGTAGSAAAAAPEPAPPLPFTTVESSSALTPQSESGAPPIVQEAPSSVVESTGIVHDSGMWMQFSAAQAPKGSPEELLSRLDQTTDVTTTTSLLDDLVLSAETASREGKPLIVADIFHGIVARESGLGDGELKRAYVMAIRRLSRPPLLRAVAMLLPRKRERAADFQAVLVRTGEDGADALIEQLTQATTAEDRRVFYDALATLQAGIPALIHMLGDARWFVVRNAADLLGEMHAKQAEGALIEVLRHRDDRVRRAATNALMNVGTPGALKAIHDAMHDESPTVRMQAAAALASRRDGKTAGTLTKALDDETDADVQLAILAALGRVATPDAVQKLVAAAEPEGRFFRKKTPAFRIEAVKALGEAGTPAALAALDALSSDRDREIRDAVQRVIAKRA